MYVNCTIFRESQPLDAVLIRTGPSLAFTVERETHYRMENKAYVQHVQRYSVKQTDILEEIIIMKSCF